jgi:hypothetical protein
MAKKSNTAAVGGGILMFIASLLYLYIGFTWYGSGITGSWLAAAQFFGPFIAAGALIGAIVLFFMSIGVMSGHLPSAKNLGDPMWKFLMFTGLVFFIVTAGGSWFYLAVLAFVISYIGAIARSM